MFALKAGISRGRRSRVGSIIFGMAALASSGAAAAQSGTMPGRAIIRNVNVVTLDERGILKNASVVTDKGRISAILAAGEKGPSGAREIDGGSGYLIAGLIDAHVHWSPNVGMVNYLRHGVTTVFSLGTTGQPLSDLAEARRKLRSGEVLGPRLYATGPAVGGQLAMTSVADVEPYLSQLQQNGLEFVKVYNEIPQPVFEAIVAGAKARKMGLFGHLPRQFPPEAGISGGINVIAHAEEFFSPMFGGPRDAGLDSFSPAWMPDYSRVGPVLDLLVANDVALIPNLVASFSYQNLWFDEEMLLSSPEAEFLKPQLREGWAKYNYSRRDKVAKRMMREQVKYPLMRALTYHAGEKGILLLAGTDSQIPSIYAGRSLHQELRLMVAAGLSYEQALRTATVNGGIATRRFVDLKACIGVIKTGCEADLVLLRANPLEDIRNTEAIVGVMNDGQWHDRATLDAIAAAR